MILKESLFNKGAYKTVLRRFRLGSLLYFIILFLCVPTMFLTRSPEFLINRYVGDYNSAFTLADSALFSTDMLILPVLVTMVVPTIVALLVFNYVHSPRHAIFTHSLPVSRKANYFSSLLGGFTLMALPVILNAIILIIVSLSGYAKVIGITPAIVWMLVFLAIIFIMFSIATFSSFLAGNPFSAAAINLIIHLLPFILAASASFFGNRYLYGFNSDNDVFEKINSASPVVNLFEKLLGGKAYYVFENTSIWIFIAISVLLYIVSYFLYKNRRMELSGDVAGFKIMHPILKYTVCSVAFILSFAMFTSMEISTVWYFLLTGLVTAIVYFASEMLLKKNLRVFHLYKGLIGFFLSAAVVVSFLAFTSVFGFETRIPKEGKIKSVAIGEYQEEFSYVSDPYVIKKATEFHKEFIKDIPVLTKELVYSEIYTADIGYKGMEEIAMHTIWIKYKLESGKIISRMYHIENEEAYKMFSTLFESKEYKLKKTGIDKVIINNVRTADINTNCGDISCNFVLNDEASEFFNALKSDIENITYDDYCSSIPINTYVSLDISPEENKTNRVFRGNNNPYSDYHFSISINPNFENSFKVLSKYGYPERMKQSYTSNLFVSTHPVHYENNIFTFNGEEFDPDSRIVIGEEFLRKLTPEESAKAYEEILLKPYNHKKTPFKENYYLFCSDMVSMEKGMAAANNIARFSPDTLPDYLK